MKKRDPKQGIDRREFLVLSSTVAAAGVAVGPNIFASAPVQPHRLAVGFAAPDAPSSLTSATWIRAADETFLSRGARLSISGTSGHAAEPKSRRAVQLLVNYSYHEGDERRSAPFHAWACCRTTGCQGNPVNFTVPVADDKKVSMIVGVQKSGGDASPATAGLPLDLGLRGGDGLKLVRGSYVIVPLFDADGGPRWSDFHLERKDGRWALLDREGQTAPFEHFVLRVDYAGK